MDKEMRRLQQGLFSLSKSRLIRADALTQSITPQRSMSADFGINSTWQDIANNLYVLYRALVQERGRSIDKDEATLANIKNVARWLSNPGIETDLLLMGLCGTGKTALATATARLITECSQTRVGYHRCLGHRVVSALTVAEWAAQNDTRQFRDTYSFRGILVLDDLGSEPAYVNAFGTDVSPCGNLLLHRYELHLPTIITTNLTFDTITDKYGQRVSTRLRETCHYLTHKNPNYRRQCSTTPPPTAPPPTETPSTLPSSQ